MKRNILTAIVALATVFTMIGQASAAESWKVDPVHSSIELKVLHNGVAPFFARFNEKSGTVMLDTANPANSSVEITVNPASFDSGNTKRNEHIMSPDFLSVKEFPTMGFHSTKVSSSGKGKYKVSGMLEIKGVKKEVSFDVTQTTGKGMKGEELSGFYTEFTINRSDWGVDAFPGGLGEQITVFVSLECGKA